MITVKVCMASPVAHENLEPATIVVDQKLPTSIISVGEFYRQQADVIEMALHNTLPGGTYDALLRSMLERRASFLRITSG